MNLIKLEKIKNNILLCFFGKNFVDITDLDKKALADSIAVEDFDVSNEFRVDLNTTGYFVEVKGYIIGEKLNESFIIKPNTSYSRENDNQNKVYVMSGKLKYFDKKEGKQVITLQQTMYDFVANLVIYDRLLGDETNELATASEFVVNEII